MVDKRDDALVPHEQIATFGQLRTRLERAKTSRVPLRRSMKRAAVSAIFRDSERGLELLLMVRASSPDDPWSGHIAFPGGRVEKSDETSRAAAIRETLEEIGLDLTRHATYVRQMSDLIASARGQLLPLVITPHIFLLEREVELTLNYEVEETMWVPFAELLNEENRTRMDYKIAGINRRLPCYYLGERVLWGLTLKMVDEIIECCHLPEELDGDSSVYPLTAEG